jgi:hypothetical protein
MELGVETKRLRARSKLAPHSATAVEVEYSYTNQQPACFLPVLLLFRSLPFPKHLIRSVIVKRLHLRETHCRYANIEINLIGWLTEELLVAREEEVYQ